MAHSFSTISNIILGHLLSLVIPAASIFKNSDQSKTCIYTVYVKTGSAIKAGTDSTISLQISDSSDNTVLFEDLEDWGGMMPKGWDYYEWGKLDVFTGAAQCLTSTPCKAVLTSDGSGSDHAWYVNYVEVSITGPQMGASQASFTVDQWLSTRYGLVAARDVCPSKMDATKDVLKSLLFVVFVLVFMWKATCFMVKKLMKRRQYRCKTHL